MKFVAGNTGIAGAVQVLNKIVHQIKKIVFVFVVMATVKPVNNITSYQFVVYCKAVVSCTGSAELFLGIQCNKVFFQVQCKCIT